MNNTLATEDIMAFLSANPDFFLRNPDALAHVNLPSDNADNVSGTHSFVERQVQLLRERNIELRERLTRFVSIADSNDTLLRQTRQIILSLINNSSLTDFATKLANGLHTEYQLDHVRLVLLTSAEHANNSEVHPLLKWDSLANAEANIPALVALQKPLCGHLRGNELAYFFGESASRVGSVALLPLNHETVRGFLVCGKTDPLHFAPNMDTFFIETLTQSIEHIMHKDFKTLLV